MALRPDIEVLQLRGNVNTRLAKLDQDEYDAIILAAAGLLRLEMPERIASLIPIEQSLPAGGQGAVGIECRLDDQTTRDILAPLHHRDTALRVSAERAVVQRLNGGCQVPIGAYAELNGGKLQLKGLVGAVDGTVIYRSESSDNEDQPESMGQALAEQLLDQGAGAILDELLKD
jgi:hydroxymethylbilane synthase